MCKAAPVLSEAWVELSPAQRKEKWRRNEDEEELCRGEGVGRVGEGRGVQVRRGKNPRQGESLDKDKVKTVQLQTSKIHKTRRQAVGYIYI